MVFNTAKTGFLPANPYSNYSFVLGCVLQLRTHGSQQTVEGYNMTMRDQIAAVALDAINEQYRNGSTRAGYAIAATDAILAALPGMIPDLVWDKSHVASWNEDYHTVPTNYTIRCADENGWKWSYGGGHGYARGPEAAKAAANTHHRAAIAKAAGWTNN
jgi:hypothetical protein